VSFLPASPWDYLTSTRDAKVRFDARKTWEAGAFIVSTFAFVWLVYSDKLTEWFFIGYMGTWVGARFLRDREQRLSSTPPK
jgi:hypothetical protein